MKHTHLVRASQHIQDLRNWLKHPRRNHDVEWTRKRVMKDLDIISELIDPHDYNEEEKTMIAEGRKPKGREIFDIFLPDMYQEWFSRRFKSRTM